jgi:phospholipase A1
MIKMTRFFIVVMMAILIINSKSYAGEKGTQHTSSDSMDSFLEPITPNGQSSLEIRVINQEKYSRVPNFVSLYEISYLLPYYYTDSPYNEVYQGTTPDNQNIMQTEFKGKFSVEVPLVEELFNNKNLSLHASYTQLVFWQFYARSQYFRETNYEPALFVNYHLYRNWLLSSGFDHQSNGRGGAFERSWNRAFGSAEFSGDKWFAKLDVWGLIFQSESSNLHNPDIEKYLGHERVTLAYKIGDLVLGVEAQNLESGLARGYFMGSLSYPLNHQINLYAQYFNGYGQSLIEYDHRTQGGGLGISFNTWL